MKTKIKTQSTIPRNFPEVFSSIDACYFAQTLLAHQFLKHITAVEKKIQKYLNKSDRTYPHAVARIYVALFLKYFFNVKVSDKQFISTFGKTENNFIVLQALKLTKNKEIQDAVRKLKAVSQHKTSKKAR